MRLRTADHRKTFNASIPTDHPASVPGPIALKRQDTGEWISLGDCFGVPGCKFGNYPGDFCTILLWVSCLKNERYLKLITRIMRQIPPG